MGPKKETFALVLFRRLACHISLRKNKDNFLYAKTRRMTAEYDLVIRGGVVADGTGAGPVVADVAMAASGRTGRRRGDAPIHNPEHRQALEPARNMVQGCRPPITIYHLLRGSSFICH
ncbi:MAG: hypothetical protein ACKV2V_01540 [Blastocatellia bacterium]